jgi:uncharacterized membrane protein
MRRSPWLVFHFLLFLAIPWITAARQDAGSVVQAVLFYSPTCGHCHYVIDEVLLPLVETHGQQLQILAIDVSQTEGQGLYQSAREQFQIPDERRGVPTLIVGQSVLVGSVEIPEQFPGLVEAGLAGGGINWPDIPGLDVESIETQPGATDPDEENPGDEAPTAAAAGSGEVNEVPDMETPLPSAVPDQSAVAGDQIESPAEGNPVTEPSAMASADEASAIVLDSDGQDVEFEAAETPPADPVGFTLAWVVLAGMVIASLYTIWRLVNGRQGLRQVGRLSAAHAGNWAIPLLAVIGLVVAGYLAYVEITHVEAVCGPVGECNIVQSSAYARIAGIPIAVLGMLNYLAIIALWGLERFRSDRLGTWPVLALLGLTIFGTIFSIYLTLLELLVIGAICAWCLTSAVLTTILMLLVVQPVVEPAPPTTKGKPAAEGTV